jgi:hypothetical protein
LNTSTLLIFAIMAILFGGLLLKRMAPRQGATAVDANSPEWRAAVLKAQASLSIAKALHDVDPGSVLVKFPVKTNRGTQEHAWGQLLTINFATFTASLESEMVESAPEASPPYTLKHSSLEDWIKFLPDGTVRGAFTVQAEIALARAEGKEPSKQAQAMEGRFVDV